MTRKEIFNNIRPFLKFIVGSKDLTIVAFIMIIVSIIIVPLNSVVLDFLLTISISLSVLIILISIYIDRPTELSTFPTIILIITLFRLALNIATTRVILSKGHEGASSVSNVIESFGNFVIGGNYVIGFIIFSILVIINFIVITNGSTRVAEVTARFTLDAMPGKQMAIDADLNAALIDMKEAKKRRGEILKEADFYGAMDGSSKFVKGDAIAGIVITIINIIGGFLIGTFQRGMTMSESASTFTILTVGDGLVSQIPALIASTATGIIITRTSKEGDGNFAQMAVTQLTSNYKALVVVGLIMVMFAIIPGLPTFSMGLVGIIFLSLGYIFYKLENNSSVLSFLKDDDIIKGTEDELSKDSSKDSSTQDTQKDEEELKDILKSEVLELHLSIPLLRLADSARGGDLLDRIKSSRKKIASDLGFIMPQVRIRDSFYIDQNTYEITLKQGIVGKGTIYTDKFLAMDMGIVLDKLEGDYINEPAFGLPSIWIDKDKKTEAIDSGYQVVDPATVIVTHISEIVKKNAHEIISRQDTQNIIDQLKDEHSIIVKDIEKVGVGIVQYVFKMLLKDKIPIKDKLTILETILDVRANNITDTDIIIDNVRANLSRIITSLYLDKDGEFKCVVFSAETESELLNKLNPATNNTSFALDVDGFNKLALALDNEINKQGLKPLVICVSPTLRRALSYIVERFKYDIVVLSNGEIDSTVITHIVSNIHIDF